MTIGSCLIPTTRIQENVEAGEGLVLFRPTLYQAYVNACAERVCSPCDTMLLKFLRADLCAIVP
jgi:hypothetical protein